MNVNIHGVVQGPQSDMAPPPTDEPTIESTKAEMTIGAAALKTFQDRTNAELEYGRSLIAKRNPPKPEPEED